MVGEDAVEFTVLDELSTSSSESSDEDSDSDRSEMDFEDNLDERNSVEDAFSQSSIKICSTRTLAPSEITDEIQSDEGGWSEDPPFVGDASNGGTDNQVVTDYAELLKSKDQTIQDQENEIDALHEENLTLQTKLREARSEIDKLKKEGLGTGKTREVEELKKELKISQLKEEKWQKKFLEIKTDLGRMRDMQIAANELIERRLADLEKIEPGNDNESESDLEFESVPQISHSQQSISPPIPPPQEHLPSTLLKEKRENVKNVDSQLLFPRRSERIFLSAASLPPNLPADVEAICSSEHSRIKISSPPKTGISGPTRTLVETTSSMGKTSSVLEIPTPPIRLSGDAKMSYLGSDDITESLAGNGEGFQCSNCPKKFYHLNLYKKHTNTHSGPKKLVPKNTIPKRLRNETGKGQEHGVNEVMSNGFFCVCGAEYKSVSALKHHVRCSISEKKFNCPSCKKKFFTTSNLRKHMISTHKMVYEKTNGCRECGDTFETRRGLYSHLKDIHNKGPLTVNRVHTVFKGSALTNPFVDLNPPVASPRKWRKVEPIVISAEDTLITDQIAAAALLSLKTKDLITLKKRNKKNNTKDEMFLEYDYWSNFSDDSSWLEYEDVKSENTDLNTSSTSMSMEHGPVNSTDGDISFKCLCGKTFKTEISINSHILTKSGLNIFKCKICSEAFARSDYLKLHYVKSHEMELPEQIVWCRKCGEEFETRKKLSKHRSKVHKDELNAEYGRKSAVSGI